MSITPHINNKQKVRLAISSEFTQVIDGVTGLSADTPTTATRKLNTEISIASGETVVIGGLIRDDKITTEKKIPLLGDIPIVGSLFKFKRDRLQKTNLLLFITPYVLSSQSDIDAITQKKKDAVTPELDQRLKDKNISEVDIFESIWR
jgi:general secretion pathway protein D